jgi:hypothetical protein
VLNVSDHGPSVSAKRELERSACAWHCCVSRKEEEYPTTTSSHSKRNRITLPIFGRFSSRVSSLSNTYSTLAASIEFLIISAETSIGKALHSCGSVPKGGYYCTCSQHPIHPSYQPTQYHTLITHRHIIQQHVVTMVIRLSKYLSPIFTLSYSN